MDGRLQNYCDNLARHKSPNFGQFSFRNKQLATLHLQHRYTAGCAKISKIPLRLERRNHWTVLRDSNNSSLLPTPHTTNSAQVSLVGSRPSYLLILEHYFDRRRHVAVATRRGRPSCCGVMGRHPWPIAISRSPLNLSRDKTDYVLCRVIWVIQDLDYCKGRFKCDSGMREGIWNISFVLRDI